MTARWGGDLPRAERSPVNIADVDWRVHVEDLARARNEREA
jgi:hypothetical protein